MPNFIQVSPTSFSVLCVFFKLVFFLLSFSICGTKETSDGASVIVISISSTFLVASSDTPQGGLGF